MDGQDGDMDGGTQNNAIKYPFPHLAGPLVVRGVQGQMIDRVHSEFSLEAKSYMLYFDFLMRHFLLYYHMKDPVSYITIIIQRRCILCDIKPLLCTQNSPICYASN